MFLRSILCLSFVFGAAATLGATDGICSHCAGSAQKEPVHAQKGKGKEIPGKFTVPSIVPHLKKPHWVGPPPPNVGVVEAVGIRRIPAPENVNRQVNFRFSRDERTDESAELTTDKLENRLNNLERQVSQLYDLLDKLVTRLSSDDQTN